MSHDKTTTSSDDYQPEPDYKEVPVVVASIIADNFDKSQVVILCYDAVYETTHVTTWGKSKFDKENAVAIGEICTNAIGCDMGKKQTFKDFHQDYSPALYKRAVDMLRELGAANTPWQDAERMIADLLTEVDAHEKEKQCRTSS